ncbi:sigma-54-dependent transcriptional regulator [Novispirillum sp. DQ9]|uniref:sigma-54-dependent transcriptional regulator n=1 Tax=Novispirillum sp. DQ9 TaxID=3398612 RepID=UPI003C7D5FE0
MAPPQAMSAAGKATRVLVIEDEPDLARMLQRIIQAAGPYEVLIRGGRFDVAALFARTPPDMVFLDLVMPDMDGFEAIELIRTVDPIVPIIVVSAYSSIDNAVKAVRLGAFDFLPKPFDPDTIELMLAKVGREFDQRARAWADEDPALAAIKGVSPQVAALKEWLRRVRTANANVLISGESGTGKELVARALHAGQGPFVAVNAAAIPAELAESELFGHRAGAFTGAAGERKGLLLAAHGGVLFLDEVNAMSPQVQAKLLRAIQDKAVRPVGAEKTIAVEFRLIAASNEDLEGAVQEGRFRRDLYHRLRVLNVTLPALRERTEDIPVLAEEFVHRYCRAHGRRARRLSDAALADLMARAWPGNIRELENAIEELVILAPEGAVEIGLPTLLHPPSSRAQGERGGFAEITTLAEMERRYVRHVLATAGGNKAQTARLLSIDYKTLLRKLAQDHDMREDSP